METREENGQQEVGDIAYWPVGKAMCIFFGKTPISDGGKPKAYSPVNVFARVTEGDVKKLKEIASNEIVNVSPL